METYAVYRIADHPYWIPENRNYLYIAPAINDNPGTVPEPATVLLWMLGGMGLAGTFRKRSVI